MKTLRNLSGLFVLSGLLVFSACDDDEPQVNVGPLSVSSISAAGTDPATGENVSKDLAGGATASDVPMDAVFTVTFSKAVDASTITDANVQLTQDGTAVGTNLATNGAVVTITPTAELTEDTEYTLTLGSGIKAEDGGVFTQTTRSFRTVGAVAVEEGLIAHWTFEENVEDQAGTFDAAEVIDIEYVEGRSEAAGMAASFNGTTSIIEIPNGPALMDTQDFTLSFWMKLNTDHTNAAGDQKGYFVMGLGGFRGFQFEVPNSRENAKLVVQYDRGSLDPGAEDLWLDATGNLGWQGWTFSEDLSDEGGLPAFIDDTWAHIVAVYDSETKIGSIYLNGRLMKRQDFNLYGDDHPATSTVGLTFNPQEGVGENFAIGFFADRSTTAFDFANYSDPDHNHFKGELDDIRIYHIAKSEEEVQAMYEAEKP